MSDVEHPAWCDEGECGWRHPRGAHRSRPWRVDDGGVRVLVWLEWRAGQEPGVRVHPDPGHVALSAPCARALAEAIGAAARRLESGAPRPRPTL